MSSTVANSGKCCLKGWLAIFLLLAAATVRSQTSDPRNAGPAKEPKQPPAFSAAGIQGSTAPSGYSSGVSREEISSVSKGVNDLNHELFSGLVPAGNVANCSREPDLVKAATANPKAFEANYALGVFYLEHGEFTRSISYLELARHADPANIDSLRALALALLGAGRNPEAIGLLESVRGNHDAALLRLLALAYRQSGEQGKSREAYQRAIAAAPGDVENEFRSGIGLITVGSPESAVELFASATAAHPNEAKLWLGLGIAQDMARRKPEAIRSLLRAVAIDPDYVPPYFFLAGLADASPESAVEIRKRLAEFVVAHPSSSQGHYDYALALWRQHRANPAASNAEIESHLKLALADDPNLAQAHYQLGVLYADSNDYVKAQSELLQAVRMEPDNADAHYRLAQAYTRSGKPELAHAEMTRFISLHDAEHADENSSQLDLWGAGRDAVAKSAIAMPCKGQP